jgi:hypothetical protein
MRFQYFVGGPAYTVVLASMLSGCAVGPDYDGVPPQTTADLPSHYKNSSPGNERWHLAVPNEAALGGATGNNRAVDQSDWRELGSPLTTDCLAGHPTPIISHP